MQRWRKLGLIFCGNRQFDWMQTHAAVPFAQHIQDDLFLVYFSSRDSESRSSTGVLVLDLSGMPRVLEVMAEPILRPGELGCFDDSGAMLSWIADRGPDRYFYYIGWNRGVTVPFRNSVGLAIGKFGQRPVRYASGPIMDRSAFEPHFATNPCVLPDGDHWHMWYLSCTGWERSEPQPIHHYHLKYARSSDGISWQREGRIAIDFKDATEYAISRPSVIHDGRIWRMWYSFRGKTYRIGYAESADAVTWQRLDHLVGLDVSMSGWDSEMIEYPHVFDHKGARYMLYNGNGYGKTGFGLAILA